jgi:hypothetical protein
MRPRGSYLTLKLVIEEAEQDGAYEVENEEEEYEEEEGESLRAHRVTWAQFVGKIDFL